MAHNPDRVTCGCGKGKVSAWDGKCGHCRTKREKAALEKRQRSAETPPLNYREF